ncbi:lactate utilization protein C [Moritella sp. 24]|uniref:LutC/YkgG family protein n=1 Tax=Moritella sp. 24 TaxID=2746230 RepID=UPI001BAA6A38|nr:lactate utilization protein C [Moritella sp. 24]QUM75735.1 lactate utilization protein C [Moritella sp. 24]
MQGKIYNRDSFMGSLAAKLGRELNTQGVVRPLLPHSPHHDVMAELSQQQLADVFLEYTKTNLNSLGVSCTKDELNETLSSICNGFGAGKVIVSGDIRLAELQVSNNLKLHFNDVYMWDVDQANDINIKHAEQAKVGIVFAEQALAESGTMVLHSAASHGRSVSLLPETSVFLIPQSQIVPRMTQAAKQLHDKAQAGERLPSCVNFISGPSSTADIELIKVVGVHGPIHAAYVVIADM